MAKNQIPVVNDLPLELPNTKVELKSKRSPYSTRYLNPNGTLTEEIYLEPRFYYDEENEEWKEINNTLTSESGHFVNTANQFKTFFAKDAGKGKILSVQKGDQGVSFTPVNARNTNGTVRGNEIVFPNIYPNTDFVYRVRGESIKESIVLQQYNQNTFTFEVELDDLVAVEEPNGAISLSNLNGQKIWSIEKPFMEDANGRISNNAIFNLREENGKVYIDIIADKNFLTDENTAYPVVIDPPLNNWNVMRDTYVSSAFPDTAYTSQPNMLTGYDTDLNVTRSFVRFFLPSLPSDSKILDTTFNVYQTNSDGTQVSVDLFRVTINWTGSITWNTQPSIATTKEATVTSSAYNEYWSWDITQLMIDWYNGDQPNYGVALKQQNESSSPARSFNTVNSDNYTPRLTINYKVDPIGFEDFWMTTKDNVNPANGNFIYQKTDVSVPARGIDLALTRTYNSRKSHVSGFFGYGWFSIVDMQIVDAGEGPITFIDEDGTRHIYGEKVGGGYDTPSGVYLDLVKNTDGTYTITRPDGRKINFSNSGKPATIVDTNGNVLTFEWDTSGNIVRIVGPANREINFTYVTPGLISSAMDPKGQKVSYSHDADANLVTVTDAASYDTTFTYDLEHNMTGIDGDVITYDTDDRLQSIERPVIINGVQSTSITNYQYDTANDVTTVVDGEGRRTDYTHVAGNTTQITENPLDSLNQSKTTFTFENNHLTKMVMPNENADNPSIGYQYEYDQNGIIKTVQLPENQVSTFIHNNQSQLTHATDFEKNTNEFKYDEEENEIEAIDPYDQAVAKRYDDVGNLQYRSHPMSTADNLISNPSFEHDTNGDGWPNDWIQVIESGATANFSLSGISLIGNKALSISNTTGYAYAAANWALVNPQDPYVVSCFVKTSALVSKAFIKVDYFDTLGNWLGQEFSKALTGTHDWTRLHFLVDTMPVDTSNIRVGIGLNAADTGTVYFDGVQFERGNVVSAYNLVENSSFERDSDGDSIPNNWETSGNLSVDDGIDSTEALAGNSSFKMRGEPGVDKYIVQRLPISGDGNTLMTLSGWSKQVGADPNGGNYAIQIAIHYTDPNSPTDWTNANSFSTIKEGWQHVIAEVTPTEPFDSIDVYYYFYDQTGTAWFDAMRLEFGASITSFDYDLNFNTYVTNITDPLGNSISYTYDKVGNRTSETDGKGNTTSFSYNGNGYLARVTNPINNITSYEHNKGGNRTKVTNAKGYVTNYAYNSFGELSSITNPLNQTTNFEYDKAGNLTEVTYENGDVVSYTYNELNRLVSVIYNGVTKWNIEYDPNGNITSIIDENGQAVTYSYNQNNWVIQKDKGVQGDIAYSYNRNGLVASMDVTVGTQTFQHGMKYNPLSQLITLSRNNINLANFTYDERGNIASILNGNGTYSAYEYNSANQLESIRIFDNAGYLMHYFIYSYNANNNIIGIESRDGSISFQYDALNQLTQETLVDGTTISYEYDSVGNRTKKTVSTGTSTTTTSYTYDAANQLIDVDGQTYTYDPNGNLISNGENIFIYNADNRLVEVQDSTGVTVLELTYDQEGRRTSKRNSTGITYYHYDSDTNNILYETDKNNVVVADYTYDQYNRPMTLTKDGRIYYYHYNGQGDVIALTDENGSVVAEYHYDTWGNMISKSGVMADENPFRYSAYYFDKEIGLYYVIARYYNPENGNFVSRDPDFGIGENPLTQNGYIYANNNPVMLYDPNGNFSVPIHGNWCGPGHGGGRTVDRLDSCCKSHDLCYGSVAYFACSCDRKLIYCIDANFWKMGIKEKSKALLVRTYFKYTWCKFWK